MKHYKEKITTKDIVDGVITSAIASIPYVNFFAHVVESVKGSVLQRRYENWQEIVGERLSKLSEEVISKLGANDSFATVLIKTTELASKTNGEKMAYLANAVKYTAENEINEDLLIIMLNCIEKYTLSHIKILKYLEDPSLYSNGKNYIAGGLFTYFDDYYPNFNKSLQPIILKELFRDGLTNTETSGTMTAGGMGAKRTTELGDLFITIFGIDNDDK